IGTIHQSDNFVNHHSARRREGYTTNPKKLERLRVGVSALLVIGLPLTACQSAAPPTTAPEGKPETSPTEAVKEPVDEPEPPEQAEVEEGPAAPPATDPETPITKYNEAPSLKELVEKGELPPVEERLPENPLVIPVVDGI